MIIFTLSLLKIFCDDASVVGELEDVKMKAPVNEFWNNFVPKSKISMENQNPLTG